MSLESSTLVPSSDAPEPCFIHLTCGERLVVTDVLEAVEYWTTHGGVIADGQRVDGKIWFCPTCHIAPLPKQH